MNEQVNGHPHEYLDPGERWGVLTPPYLDIPGVTPQAYARIFSAAAQFYRLAPWRFFEREVPLAVTFPSQERPRACVLLGAGGQEFGMLVYDSPADLRKAARETDPMKMAREITWLALTYESCNLLAPQDIALIHENSWEVAGEGAYPLISRAGAPDADLRSPAAADLFWLGGVLPVLAAFYERFASPVITGIGRADEDSLLPFEDCVLDVMIASIKDYE